MRLLVRSASKEWALADGEKGLDPWGGLARKEELEADSPQRCFPPGTIPCPHSGGPRRSMSHLRMWARFLVQPLPAGFSRPSSRVSGEFHHITNYLALS